MKKLLVERMNSMPNMISKKSENENAYYVKQFEVHFRNPKLLQCNEKVSLCVSETTQTYTETRITMVMDELHTGHAASNAATLSSFIRCSAQNLWARYSKVNQCPALQFQPSLRE